MKRTQHVAYFKIPYKQKDKNNDNFCCGDKKSSKGDGITDNEDPELNQFYYHSDHLGSSSYITNLNGSIVQHVEYVPFGEVFLEEKNNKWNTPYLFNGKELDEETGLYYYGARYYNSRNSLWLSVDPLAEKYPGISPYCYTLNNPVKFIDPDGREVDWWRNNKTGETENIENKKVWDSKEMSDKGYSYLGEYKISDETYISMPEIFNSDQDAWAPGINIDKKQYGRWNLGGKHGNLEGEEGLVKVSNGMNNVGNILLLTPISPVGGVLMIGSSIIDTGLDFKNKPQKEAFINLSIRLGSILLGKYIGKEISKYINNNFNKKVLDAGVNKALNYEQNKNIKKIGEKNKKDD